MKIDLTPLEIEALHAAARNVDPCMFTEDIGGREGTNMHKAWERGIEKLGAALDKLGR